MVTIDFLSFLKQMTYVPDEQMDRFTGLLQKDSYVKNEHFVKAGEYSHHIGYVLKGLFRLYYIDLEGNEYTKNFSAENDFIVAYASLLQRKPSHLYIEALEDSEVLLIPYSDLQDLLECHICWQIILRKITEKEYLVKEKRESELLFYDTKTRYLNFRNEYPNLEKRLNQKYIASYLGMSPETLSRIRSILK